MREHYESVERQTGIVPEALQVAREHPCPELLRYLWQLFCDVSQRRQFGERDRPLAISSGELRAWLQLRQLVPTPSEVDVLDRLEAVYLASWVPPPAGSA